MPSTRRTRGAPRSRSRARRRRSYCNSHRTPRMHAFWSFWSKPFYAFKGRIWREPVHHLLAWGLSLRLARKHYPETHLVTDEAGAELLVERLGLSFTHV